MKKMYLSPNKKLLGVCSGIADYLNIDPVLIRIIFVTISFMTAFVPCIVAYIVVSLVVPDPPVNYNEIIHNSGKKLRKGKDKKIAGVCSGLAEFFGVDASIIRILFLLLAMFIGYGFITYLICLCFMPQSANDSEV